MRTVTGATDLLPLQPATYLVAGRIDALDTSIRRVRLASRDLEVVAGIRLDRFQVGDRVVAHTAQASATGRVHVIGLAPGRVLDTRAGRGVARRVLDTAARVARGQRTIRESRS